MRGLQELIELTPPPATPEGAPFDWGAAEAALGTALPADYRAFCDRYGHGSFSNGWGWFPLTPFARDDDDDLLSTYWRDLLADTDRGQRPFPEPGGVLPFALSELKYTFWWLVDGPPDSWPTLLEDDGGTWHRFESTATELLALALRNGIFHGDAGPVTFTSRPRVARAPHAPFVISGYGTLHPGAGEPPEHTIELDLAGGLGGTRRARLDELLAALDPALRATIVRAEAKRSMEVLHLRARGDIDPLLSAVQAWADRVSGWS